MHATRLIASLALSSALIVYTFLVYLAWEKETPSYLGGLTPEPNDLTVIFFIFGIISIWSSKKLWQQIVCCLISMLGIMFMHSLLPHGI
jgi:hypothetical protein